MGKNFLDWVFGENCAEKRIGTTAAYHSGQGMRARLDTRELKQPVREMVSARTRMQTIFDHTADER